MEKIGDDCRCQQEGSIASECVEGVLGKVSNGVRTFPPLLCSLDANNFVMPAKRIRARGNVRVDRCACGRNKLAWLGRCIVCINEERRGVEEDE